MTKDDRSREAPPDYGSIVSEQPRTASPQLSEAESSFLAGYRSGVRESQHQQQYRHIHSHEDEEGNCCPQQGDNPFVACLKVLVCAFYVGIIVYIIFKFAQFNARN